MIIKQILDAKGRAVVTIPSDATVADVAGALSANGIGVIVVLDPSEKIAGIVSERDIVRGLGRRGVAMLDLEVGEIMTNTVITCEAETNVNDVMSLMTANKIRHLPVVDADDRLTGLISIGDVVNALLARAQLDRETYLATG